jgi:hypothetical protein
VAPARLPRFFVVVVVLAVVVVDDPQDLDEAEGGSQPAQGRLLVGVDLGHDSGRLPPRWLVAPGPQVQVDPAAPELELVDLALAVVLIASLERAFPDGRSTWPVRSESLCLCRVGFQP